MSRVFVPQEPARAHHSQNINLVADFGAVHILCPQGPAISRNNLDATIRSMRAQLEDFSDKDYLVISGHPLVISIAMFFAAAANEGRVCVLRWHDQSGGSYRPTVVSLWHGEEEESLNGTS